MSYASQLNQGIFNVNTGLGIQSDVEALEIRIEAIEADEPENFHRDGSRLASGNWNINGFDLTVCGNITGDNLKVITFEAGVFDDLEAGDLLITTLNSFPTAGTNIEVLCDLDMNNLNLLNVNKILNTGDLFIQLGTTKTLYFGIDGINYIFTANNTEIQFNKDLDMNNNDILSASSVTSTLGIFSSMNSFSMNGDISMNNNDITSCLSITGTTSNFSYTGATQMTGALNLAGQALNNIATCTSNNTMIFGTSNGYIDLQCSSGQKVYIQQYGGGSMFEFSTSTGNKTYQDINMNGKAITSCYNLTSSYATISNLGSTTMTGAINLAGQALNNLATCISNNTIIFGTSNGYIDLQCSSGQKVYIQQYGGGSMFEFSASSGNKTYQDINMNGFNISSCLSITSTTVNASNLSSTTLQGSMNVNAQTLTNVKRIDIDNTNAYLSFYTGGGIKSEVWRLGTNTLLSIGSSGTLDGIGTIKGYTSEMIFRDNLNAIKLKLNGNGVDFNGVQAYSAGGIYFANDPTNNYIAETNTPYHLTLNGVYDMRYYVNKSNANVLAKHRFYHYTSEIVAVSSTGVDLNTKTITGVTGLYGSANLDIIYHAGNAIYFKNASAVTKMTIADTAVETHVQNITFNNTSSIGKVTIRTDSANHRLSILGPDSNYYSTIIMSGFGVDKYAIESIANSTSLSYHMLIKDTTNGVVGSIVTLGGSTAFNTTSDYRTKRDVKEMDYKVSYEKLKKIKPCHYKFIKDETNREHSGFIAHELKEIIPSCVTGEKDAFHLDKNGNKVDDYQAVDYSKLVPDLVCVVQGLMKEIEELKDEIKLLKSK